MTSRISRWQDRDEIASVYKSGPRIHVMAKRTTRNKIRFQVNSAYADLTSAQGHLIAAAALADDRSDYMNNELPLIVASLDAVITVVGQFEEGL